MFFLCFIFQDNCEQVDLCIFGMTFNRTFSQTFWGAYLFQAVFVILLFIFWLLVEDFKVIFLAILIMFSSVRHLTFNKKIHKSKNVLTDLPVNSNTSFFMWFSTSFSKFLMCRDLCAAPFTVFSISIYWMVCGMICCFEPGKHFHGRQHGVSVLSCPSCFQASGVCFFP